MVAALLPIRLPRSLLRAASVRGHDVRLGYVLMLPSPGPVTSGGEGPKVMCDALALHEAYEKGDLDALQHLLGDPPDFPNCRGRQDIGEIILEYAIYHTVRSPSSARCSSSAPIRTIRTTPGSRR
jgi:hypothetical protein